MTALPNPLKRRTWQAFASALTLESAAIAAALAWIATHPPQTLRAAVALSIEAAQPEPVPVPEPEKPMPPAPPPKPVPHIQPVPAARPLPAPALTPTAAPADAPSIAPAAPSVFAAPAAPAPAPTPSVPGPVDPSAEYIAKVKAAVQAAVVYPPAAAALGFRGRTRVEFRLRDGVSSQARVLMGSGMGLIDRAALQSVQAAAYPAPPADLQGKEHSYQVWVEFNP
jgi:protein TonB